MPSRAVFFGANKLFGLLQSGGGPPEPETVYTGLEGFWNLHDASGADPWVDQHLGGVHLSAAGTVGGGVGYRYRAARPGSTTGERLYSTSSIFNPGESDFYLSFLFRLDSGPTSGSTYVMGLGPAQSDPIEGHGWSLQAVYGVSDWLLVLALNATDTQGGPSDVIFALQYDTWYFIEAGIRTADSTVFCEATPVGTALAELGAGSSYTTLVSRPGAEFSVGASTATQDDGGGYQVESLRVRSQVPSLAIRQQLAPGGVPLTYAELATGVADTFAIYQAAGKVRAWWSMDEAPGGARLDATGNGNHLAEVIENSTTNVLQEAGIVGQAARFYRTSTASPRPGVLRRNGFAFAGSFGFLTWIWRYALPPSLDVVLGESDPGFSQRAYYVYTRAADNNQEIQWLIRDSANNTTFLQGNRVELQEWTMLGFWWDEDGGQIGMSKNLDTPLATSFVGPVLAPTNPVFEVGDRPGTGQAPLNGNICETLALEAPPSSALIAQFYNSGAGIPYPGS